MTAAERDRTRFVVTTVEVEGREEETVVEVPAFEPIPWSPRARLEHVGSRAIREDGYAKVTGAARYTADIQLPRMLYARILRAPIARGGVSRLDVSAARAIPGVRAVLTGRDIPSIDWLQGTPLLSTQVLYPGQPVAAVAANSPSAAEAGVHAILARWSAREHTVGIQETTSRPRRRRGAPAPPTTTRHRRGNAPRAIRSSPVVLTQTYTVPAAVHHALEPHGSVVWWQGDRVTVYDSTQGIFRVRRQLAAHLGLRSSQVRVITEHMGGGFGSKNDCGSYTVLAALLSKRTRQPVKLVLDRAEVALDTGHRPATVMRLTLAAGRNGQLSAIDLEAWIAMGADGWEGGPGQLMHRMYRCPNVRTVEHFVYTNTGPMSAFRAPFYVEGAFALESGMDLMASRLRLDPIDFRMRNLADGDQERGRPYSTNELPACYADVARRIGWEKRGPASRTSSSKHVRRGIGMAAQLWGAGGGPPAYAEVRINRDGTALVATGTQDLGTGSRTILSQIAAEVLGLELSRVRVVLGDTDAGPYAGNSWGSMTTASVGPAVRMAAEDARRQVCEVAAALMELSPERLTLRRGRVRVRGGRKSIAIERVTEHLGNIMIVGRGHRGPNPESVTVASFGAQAAEVEVDMETGIVRVRRIVAAHDCGRAINPELAESQLHGGIIQGLGYALFERFGQDPKQGTVLTTGLHDYKIPTLADTPSIDARVISHGDPMANHTGAKGLAEPPIIPTAPAIANAVFDALGVQPTTLPLTPATLLELIKKRRRRT